MVRKLIALAMLLLTPQAFADPYGLDYENMLSGSVAYFDSQVVPVLRQLSSNDERARIDLVDIEVVKNPANISAPVTGMMNGRRKIVITTGFLDALYRYGDVQLLQAEHDRSDLVEKYFNYYLDTVLNGDGKPPLPPYVYFLPSESRARWLSDPDIVQARNTLFMSGVSTVLTHEVAHQALDNLYTALSPYHEKKAAELNADTWAYRKLDDAGEEPVFGAIMAAGLILQYERYQDTHYGVGLRHHPAPVDRAVAGWEATCGQGSKPAYRKPCEFLANVIDDMR